VIAEVREMRESGMTQQAIADEVGMSQTHVSVIVRGAGRTIRS
jgi:transcriptional regulator